MSAKEKPWPLSLDWVPPELRFSCTRYQEPVLLLQPHVCPPKERKP